jgi:hypothetical protein
LQQLTCKTLPAKQGVAIPTGTPFAFTGAVFECLERGCSVLKITQEFRTNGMVAIKLEGEILEPWVGDLRKACSEPDADRLSLDLTAISYVDGAGAQLLREVVSAGAHVAACSSYIRELLRLEHRE